MSKPFLYNLCELERVLTALFSAILSQQTPRSARNSRELCVELLFFLFLAFSLAVLCLVFVSVLL